jgi:hypothetical protein
LLLNKKNMAKLKSLIKLEGTLDELTFYKTQDGHLVRQKGGVNAERIASDPAFARTRENGREFGNAASAGKLLRQAFREPIMVAKDNRVTSRLTKVLRQMMVHDDASMRGDRNVAMALQTEIARKLLKGFHFNQMAPIEKVLSKTPIIDSNAGKVLLENLNPSNDLYWPAGANLCEISMQWACIDFMEGTYTNGASPVESVKKLPIVSSYSFMPNIQITGSGILCIGLLLDYYQVVNGINYSIQSNAYNSFSLLDVSQR